MYSSVETYYTLKMDEIYEDETIEVELILSGGNPDKSTCAESAISAMSLRSVPSSVEKPISLYQSRSYLKANITLNEKMNIKVLNSTTDLPVYMRQYVPSGSNEVMINISRWFGGYYNIIFTNSSGEVIAKGTIYID
jgi:hypothetical protein